VDLKENVLLVVVSVSLREIAGRLISAEGNERGARGIFRLAVDS